MPAPSSPPRTRTSSLRRRLSYGQPDLRVSDAERSEVADRLAEHYGDGRLDEAEFSERVDQAMRAKTRSDLAGLFDDLPDGEAPEVISRPRRGHGRHPVLLVALVIMVMVVAGNALAWLDSWRLAMIAGLVLAVLYLGRHRDQRGGREDRSEPPGRP
jgi:Flp pilus assembly protein TadB